MTPKEISRLSSNIFLSIRPANWATRNQEDQEDYGIDYEFELTTPQDQPTGFIFKVQQKGNLQLKCNAAGDAVSLSRMSVAKMRYYLEEINIPVILVAVDVSVRRCFWTNLQGNPVIEAAYCKAIERQNKSMTVHISTTNQLPETFASLLEGVSRSQTALLCRGIRRASSRGLLDAATSAVDLESLNRSIQCHYDYLRCEQIQRLLRENRDVDAFRKAQDIFRSTSESVEMRFAAGLNVTRIQGAIVAASRDPKGNEERIQTSLVVASTLLTLCRLLKAGHHLRDYARFLMRSARLNLSTDRDYGIAVSRRIQQQAGDEFTQYVIEGAQRQAAKVVLKEIHRTQVAIVRIIRRRHIEIVPTIWGQLADDVLPFILRLRDDGLSQAENDIMRWSDAIAAFAFKVAIAMKVWCEAGLCVDMYMALSNPGNAVDSSARAQTARAWVQDIDDEAERVKALGEIAYFENRSGETINALSLDDEHAYYRQMAAGLGIDLNDDEDRTAQIVNIGLRDLNPERVLRTCQHLFTSPGAHGMPARLLALPTAGSKWLHCTKLGYAIRGKSLDGIYELFHTRFCDSCEHRSAHPQEWKWSRQWQRQQNEIHQKIAERAEKEFCGRFGSSNDDAGES